jgi:hypothetical protein
MRLIRKLVAQTASAALCLATTWPAMAQEYRPSAFDGPRGAHASIQVRVPLGARPSASARPTVGLTLGYGRPAADGGFDGPPRVQQVRVTDLRFDRQGLARAQLAGFDLAQLDADRRLNLSQRKSYVFLFIVVMFVVTAAGVILTDDTDDYEPPARPDPTTPTPG